MIACLRSFWVYCIFYIRNAVVGEYKNMERHTGFTVKCPLADEYGAWLKTMPL